LPLLLIVQDKNTTNRQTLQAFFLIAEENPKVVAERLGHASIVLTLDSYSHVLPTMQKEATNKIEKLMFGT
jgi:integrase